MLWWLPPEDEARPLEIAELLVAHDADPSIKNSEGKGPADRARRLALFAVAELLDRSGSGLNPAADPQGIDLF